jgi:TM2 domain-containing membrane protein YozV
MFEAFSLNTESVSAHEEQIRLRVRKLDDPQRKIYYAQFKREMKDPDTYAVLNYFFLTGLHHMYLGQYVRGAANLVTLIFGIGLVIVGATIVGSLLIGFILLVELLALFRAQVVVANHNNLVSESILTRLPPG